MTHINVKIDEGIHFALEELARINKISKSDVIRDALQQYVNGMITDHLSTMDKRLESIEKMFEKELHRYNSLLAKNTLYSVATRYHLSGLHGKIIHSIEKEVLNNTRTEDERKRAFENLKEEIRKEVKSAENAAWKKAVEITQKHYTDAGFKVESDKGNEEVKDD